MNLIVCSDDGGKNWNDLSEHLNEAARDENGRIGDFLKDILFTSNNEITVLSIRGKIYRSNDNGNSWRLSSYLPDEPEQTCICDLGELADERLFVSGGAVATEGIWGMLAVQQDDKTWKRFRLPGFYFSEVEFLSLNEVIAVGSVVEGLDVDIDNGGRGVVLHSTDGGETWTIVYKSSASSELTSIYVISELNILVGGKSGEIIKLHK
ncbi:MAG: WD40/YVTN/BNR-like repeat-containing protein [Blastocatellia bacterium]